jgi:hypothetical protein
VTALRAGNHPIVSFPIFDCASLCHPIQEAWEQPLKPGTVIRATSAFENRLFSAVETEANTLSEFRSILVLMEDGFIRKECDIYERIAVAEATLSNLGSQYSGLKERLTTKIDSVGDEMRELRLLQGNSVLAMQKNSGSGQRRVQF